APSQSVGSAARCNEAIRHAKNHNASASINASRGRRHASSTDLRLGTRWFSTLAMTTPRSLTRDEFLCVVRNTPLVSIDIIIKDRQDKVLLGLRLNEPAKGKYFVPGGVIRKNESIAAAFARIIKAETGIDKPVSEATFIGVFEHIYETNTF